MAKGPFYDLVNVKTLVASSRWRPTKAATRGAFALRFDQQDIVECVGALTREDFDKTDPSRDRPGYMLDVYHPTYDGVLMYVKFQVEKDRDGHDRCVIVSFKRNDKDD